MKKWIITLAAAALTVALAMPASAQKSEAGATTAKKPGAAAGAKGQGKKGGGKMRALLAKLNLTAEQKTKIQDIQKASREETKKLREGGQPSPENKTKLKELRKQTTDKIMAVLTPEQQKTLKEEMKKAAPASAAKGKKKGKKAAAAAPATTPAK